MVDIYTTVDVTESGVKHKQEVMDGEWHLKRNQQRNFDSLMQAMSLRTQVTVIKQQLIDNVILVKEFGFGKDLPYENASVWQIGIEYEHPGVFGQECELLMDDIHNVPIIPGLTETCPCFPPVFLTNGWLQNTIVVTDTAMDEVARRMHWHSLILDRKK